MAAVRSSERIADQQCHKNSLVGVYTSNEGAFLYARESIQRIAGICKPLQDRLGINAFGYLKIYKGSTYLRLMNGFEDYQKNYFSSVTTQDNMLTNIYSSPFKFLVRQPSVSVTYGCVRSFNFTTRLPSRLFEML